MPRISSNSMACTNIKSEKKKNTARKKEEKHGE